MNKKTWYWIGGIALLVALGIVLYLMFGGSAPSGISPPPALPS